MEAIKLLVKNAKAIDVDVILQNLLSEPFVERFIIDLNTKKQLFEKGVDINNVIVGYYSYNTEHKYGGGLIGKYENDPYNFENTGDFFKSFGVRNYYKHLEIEADTRKMQSNDKIKGKELVGLTAKSLQELIDAIEPIFIQRIKEAFIK